MFKQFLLLFTLAELCVNIGAQQFYPVIVSPGGNCIETNSYSISYTIGEPAIKSLTSPDLFLTQGFQQGDPGSSPGDTGSINEIRMFPNPVIKKLTIQFFVEDIDSYYVSVYAVTGSLIYSLEYKNLYNKERKTIDFSILPRGLYLIKTQSINGTLQHTFKIVKN